MRNVFPSPDDHVRCVICLGNTWHNLPFAWPGKCLHCTAMSCHVWRSAMCDDLLCAQPSANEGTKGQSASSPSPSLRQRSTPLRPVCFSSVFLSAPACSPQSPAYADVPSHCMLQDSAAA